MSRAFRLKTWKEKPRYILINVRHEEIGRMSPEQSYYYILDMQNNNSEKQAISAKFGTLYHPGLTKHEFLLVTTQYDKIVYVKITNKMRPCSRIYYSSVS
jgi:hypothetical protein